MSEEIKRKSGVVSALRLRYGDNYKQILEERMKILRGETEDDN